jgi:hypothetical protein
MRDERLSAIDRADGFVTGDLAGVPEVTLVLAEKLLAAGHQETVSGLPLAAFAGLDDPAQARGRFLYAEGIDPVFAAEIRGREGFASVGLGVWGQGSGEGGTQENGGQENGK